MYPHQPNPTPPYFAPRPHPPYPGPAMPYTDFPAGLVPHQRGWHPDLLDTTQGRPGTVIAASVMAYLGAAVQGLTGLLLLIGSTNPGFVRGFGTGSGLVGAGAGLIAVLGLFCLVMTVTLVAGGVLAQSGRNVGRIALSAAGGLGMLLQVYSIAVGGFLAVLGLIWIATGCALLWTGRANDWYRRT